MKNCTKRLNFDLGYVILLGTLLVSIPRYAAAFSQSEPALNLWGYGISIAPVTGLGFGLLLEVGIYYVIRTWFDARRRGLARHDLLLVGAGVQLVIGPAIVAPAIVGHLRANPGELAAVLTWPPALWGWSVLVAVAPALLLAAVSAASYMKTPASNRKATAPSGKKPEPRRKPAGKSPRLPEWLPVVPEDKRQFISLVRQGTVRLPEHLTGEELARYVPVSPRAARGWLADARSQNGH